MAVQSQQSLATYLGNNSTVTAYPVPFAFLLTEHVQVRVKLPDVLEPIALSQGVDYTLTPNVDGSGNYTGGEVTTAVAYDASHTVFIFRDVPYTQLTEFPELGRFPANSIEKAYDKCVQLCQQLQRAVARCFRVSDFSNALTAPYPVQNTVVGIGANNDIRLFDGPALLSLIQLPGSLVDAPTAYWLNDIDRPLKVPDFIGQIGFQLNDSSLWYSTGLAAGNWTVWVLDEDDMASDDPRRAASQQSVKAWTNSRLADDLANKVVGPSSSVGNKLAMFDGETGKLIRDSGIGVLDEDDMSSNSAVDLPTQQSLKAYVDARTPTGVVLPYAGTIAPSGYLLCYGQEISRTTYADLFTVIGTTYGVGDGSTTFRVPDLRGRVPAGKDNMGGSSANRLTDTGTGNSGINGATLGASGGVDRHQLTIPQMPSHSHTVQERLAYNTGGGGGGVSSVNANTLSTGSAGGDQAHPNVQPTLILQYIIKY